MTFLRLSLDLVLGTRLHHGALTHWLLVIFVWWHHVLFLYLTFVGPLPPLIMKYLILEKVIVFVIF